jgi:hypothetical protein
MPTYSVVAQSPGGFRVPVTLSIVSEFTAAKIGVDRSVQAEAIGVPMDRVDQHTGPERETTATRRSSTPGRSSQLPGPVCVAASGVAIRSRGWVRPSAMPAASGHGATPQACTPATTTAVVPTLGALGGTPWSGASVDAGVGAAPEALGRQRGSGWSRAWVVRPRGWRCLVRRPTPQEGRPPPRDPVPASSPLGPRAPLGGERAGAGEAGPAFHAVAAETMVRTHGARRYGMPAVERWSNRGSGPS